MLENRIQVRQTQKHTLTPELMKSFQLYDLPFQALGHFVRQMTTDNLFLEFDNSLLEDCTGLLAADGPMEWEHGTSALCDPRDHMVSQDPCDSLLHELRLQVLLSNASAVIQHAALKIVESLDVRGYLAEPLEQLAARCGVSHESAEQGLTLVQTLLPRGIGARNLRECLEIQARDAPDYPLIRKILGDDSGCLERRDFSYFSQLCAVSKAKIEQIFTYLSTLQPCPGESYRHQAPAHFIYPDILIRRNADSLDVTLSHGDRLLRLDTGYYQQLRQAAQYDKPSRAFVRKQYNEAREWLHILQLRQSTLARFACCLAQMQCDYFSYGPGHMQPLRLWQLAEQMNIHPSIVCRLAKNKYIQTDWGTIQASTLFTGAFYTDDSMVAADTVKKLLCTLVRTENPFHPASDQELAAAVEQELNIQISRRTIAKYRAALGIACRRERKKHHNRNGG